MPRTRDLAPGLYTNYRLFELEQATGLPVRLSYSGLWTNADREGRFRWDPPRLKLNILPYDACDFGRVLAALEEGEFIRKYAVDGVDFGHIPTWKRHQRRIHPREAPSRIPPPPKDLGERLALGEPKASQGLSKVHQDPSGPFRTLQAFQDPSGRGQGSPSASPPATSTTSTVLARARDLIPDDYRLDLDRLLRAASSPESLAMEISTLATGKSPTATGATPEDVGRGIRELLLNSAAPSRLGKYVEVVLKRRTASTLPTSPLAALPSV